MPEIKWTEKLIRLALFRYCKLKRNAHYLAHAVCDNDFVAVINNSVYEFEIKTSIVDLKNEAKKFTKLEKHKYYASRYVESGFYPHYFYFAVPKELVEKTVEFCNEYYPAYGVISIIAREGTKLNHRRNRWGKDGTILIEVNKIEKRSKLLRPKGLIEKEENKIIARMGVLVIDYYKAQMKGTGIKFGFWDKY